MEAEKKSLLEELLLDTVETPTSTVDLASVMEATTKRANKAFSELTKAEQRVAIACDVLAQIEAMTIVPTAGHYVRPRYDNETYIRDRKFNMPKVVGGWTDGKGEVCHACALGSMFLSTVAKQPELGTLPATHMSPYGAVDANHERQFSGLLREDTVNPLLNYFNRNTLNIIENLFECGWVNGGMPVADYENHWGPAYWGVARPVRTNISATTRLKILMQNIIKNNGDFKYDDKPKIDSAGNMYLPGFRGCPAK